MDLEGPNKTDHRLFVHRQYQGVVGIALALGSARRSGVGAPVRPSCPVVRHISHISLENYQDVQLDMYPCRY